MVNDAIITKNTGWHTPNMVNQYNKYGKVNQYTCYAYSDLNDIKKKDSHYAYIPYTGGVNQTHRSPRVYCSGYNFNVPSNATITKILVRQKRCMNTYSYDSSYIKDELITLKLGASTSDLGIYEKGVGGHNLSEGTRWNFKTKGWGEHTVGETYKNKQGTVQEVWGVYITPAMVNNQNFGCIVQCIGTNSVWHCPKIDTVEMCVYYTQVGSTASTAQSDSTPQLANVESMVVKEYKPDDSEVLQVTAESINEDYVYTPFHLWIQYKNYYDSNQKIIPKRHSNTITITLNENIRFINGQRTLTIPSFEFKESSDERDRTRGFKTVFKDIYVYPVKAGEGVLTITGVNYTVNEEPKKTQTVSVTIDESGVSLTNSICELNRVQFTNCNATKGTAIYNLGALTIRNAKFNDISKEDKCFFDFDKYRDSEYR